MTEYPCGCRPGFWLCKQAEALWQAATLAWQSGDYERYDKLRAEYDAHFRQQEAT